MAERIFMKTDELKDLDMSPARVMLINAQTNEAFYIGDVVPADLRRDFFPVKAIYEPEFNVLQIYVRRVRGGK